MHRKKGKKPFLYLMATSKEESLVSQGGAELVSPILVDSEQDWKAISDICDHIKKYPGTKGNEVVANGDGWLAYWLASSNYSDYVFAVLGQYESLSDGSNVSVYALCDTYYANSSTEGVRPVIEVPESAIQ